MVVFVCVKMHIVTYSAVPGLHDNEALYNTGITLFNYPTSQRDSKETATTETVVKAAAAKATVKATTAKAAIEAPAAEAPTSEAPTSEASAAEASVKHSRASEESRTVKGLA